MRPHWLAILAILLSCGALRAEIVTVTVEATGADPQDATSNALVEAVRQVNGVSISASQLLETTTVSGIASDSEGNSASFSSTHQQRGAVGVKSGGHLAGYEVLESGPSEYGYRVVLKAGIHRYRAPGIASDNRRKLALIPFGSRLPGVDFFGPVDGADLADNLSSSMLAQFVQSRRFAILDRESWDAIGNELALLASSTTPIGEKAKLGRTLGADYLVLGELLEADGGDFVQTERLTGVRKRQAVARIAVAYRIVVPATGEIKFADTLEIAATDQQGHLLTSRTSALNELSKRLVGIALDRIYPMQVISADGSGQIVLNQGGSTLSTGDRLVLVEQGKAMIDPYTKEPLGRLETPVAQIEVVRADGKMTYARLLGDSPMSPKVGQLARRDLALYDAGSANDVPAPSPRSEGVRLPFDR
jgi:hypothetical protein